MLDDIIAFFTQHPVFSKHISEVCVALTGSFAFGLGGRGADVDALVLCPGPLHQQIRQELAAAGIDPEEEEFPFTVGDYSLVALPDAWAKVESYADMTSLFVYGNLIYLTGDQALLDSLVSHCGQIPPAVLQREMERERGAMGQALYAFLRSFQNEDEVARLLARAELVRTAMRLAFLADAKAPPYDKHLFRLLPQTAHGPQVAELIRRFLAEDAAETYEAVAATTDWHAMYEAAAETPAVRFQRLNANLWNP